MRLLRTVAHRGGGSSKGATVKMFAELKLGQSEYIRFWNKVLVSNSPAQCWKWIGHRDKNGYGHLRVESQNRLAHRIAWLIATGSLPNNRLVCHSCDNPQCTNPDHLFLGTYQDNALDSCRKGRFNKAQGEASGQAKFTAEQVRQFRREWIPKVFTMKMIAAKYQISIHTIRGIIMRKSWKSIP